MGTSSKKLALELSEVAADSSLPASSKGRRVLGEALASRDARLVVSASKLIATHTLSDFEEPLQSAYQALADERAATSDPGCLAKEGVLIALDALESLNAELFAAAAMYTQWERAKGGLRDIGARVRTRGLLALARLGHADLLSILGSGLADRDPTVRLSAARAAGHRGQREAAGLLLLRLGVGDDEPEVTSECLRALFAVAPDLGLRHARTTLLHASGQQRERTLHALGTAPADSAVDLLAEELTNRPLAEERRQVIEALGLSLRPRARALLLELVRSGRSADAEQALSTLAIHRYDDRLVEQLRELTAHSRELTRRFRELYMS